LRQEGYVVASSEKPDQNSAPYSTPISGGVCRQRRRKDDGYDGRGALRNPCSHDDGWNGRAQVESFYRDHFVGHWPDDVEVKRLSRTVGKNRVVDEFIVSFTYDRELKCYLPGIPPTGRKVILPNVVVMGFDDDGRVAYEHIYRDQASLLDWPAGP
jgi:hypothetical protein